MSSHEILLVEDNVAHIELIRRSFESDTEMLNLHIAKSLTEFDVMLKNANPDIILADMNLPDGKGLDLLSRSERVPVVVMTSFGNEEIAVDALRKGALDYVVKSEHTFSELPHIIKRALREWDHITTRQRTQKALEQSEARFRAIVENSMAGIFISNPDGELVFVNREIMRLFGYTADELINVSLSELFAPSCRDLIKKLRTELLYSDRSAMPNIEVEFVRKDGQQRYGELSMTFHVSPVGESQILGQLIDITDRKVAEQHKLELKLEQEKVDLLHLFIGNVTHDLKTPLAIIKTSLHLLGRHTDPAKQKEKIDIINIQTNKLNDLIQNLLALTRLDYHAEMDYEFLVIEDVIHDITRQFRTLLEKKNLEIILDFENGSTQLLIDRREMTQALFNIVENAVNYTPDGGMIFIRTKAQGTHYGIEIEDTGIGIDEDELSQIFDRFYRSKEAKSTVSTGSGIGLAIVKRVIKMHDGDITVESRIGVGTKFIVTLPIPAARAN